jgi:hypothetical protein
LAKDEKQQKKLPWLHNPDAMVAIGGHHATYMDKQILRESASVKRRTIGDAEKVLRWLLQAGVHFSANDGG